MTGKKMDGAIHFPFDVRSSLHINFIFTERMSANPTGGIDTVEKINYRDFI